MIYIKKTILFIGDSVTDCNRDRLNMQRNLYASENYGTGYANLVASYLGAEFPEMYTFYNRGICGARLPDVYSNLVRDILTLKPDYISILIGVNDIMHGFEVHNGTTPVRFEKIYNMLLDEIIEELPSTKIMIMEPFVLPEPENYSTNSDPNRFHAFDSGLRNLSAIARSAAEKHNLPFVELQRVFSDASAKTADDYWLFDGVHPTANGHELIKRMWLKTFSSLRSE